jgi:uncharacterized protein (TIRG00374 family)
MKRRILFWILIAVFAGVVVSHLTDITKLVKTLAQGRWEWVVAAAALQFVRFIIFAMLYWSSFDIVGVKSRIMELLPVVFASVFVNVAAPVAGVGGLALFVDDAARRDQSAARASAGTLLVLVADYSVFALLLPSSLSYLFARGDLKTYEIASAALLLLFIGGLAAMLVLGFWRPTWVLTLFRWGQRAVNQVASWFKRPAWLADDWAARNASEFTEAASAITTYPKRLIRTLAVVWAMWMVNMASLYVLFLAFYRPITIGILAAGFAVGTLFWILAITPQGVGVVEGVMVLVYTSLGIPGTQAAVIVLAFRGLSFWLPLLVGFVLLRRIRSFRQKKDQDES